MATRPQARAASRGGVDGTTDPGQATARDRGEMSSYQEFLAAKRRMVYSNGIEVDDSEIHQSLFPFQRRIVKWAIAKGKAAIFADTGLGKTRMQLEWARLMGGTALILAPLAVCPQTIFEAHQLGIDLRYLHDGEIEGDGLYITNYERASRVNPDLLTSVVLDESSILKNVDGKTRRFLTDQFQDVKYRLACTATPAPNDVSELTNHAEWLGVSSRVNMLAAYFVHDDDGWRLKGHAVEKMWEWVASWAAAIRRPSDLGYVDGDYQLPGLEIISHLVDVKIEQEGRLFATDLGGVGGRASVRRATLSARVGESVGIVENEPDESWIIWCGLNDEAAALAKAIPGSVNLPGSWTPESKAEAVLDFVNGRTKVLISKPAILGFGMNFQHCARMIFVGLSDSYESYYQCIRRSYRFGQHRRVDVHIVLSELERQIAQNVARKESTAHKGVEMLVKYTREQLEREP